MNKTIFRSTKIKNLLLFSLLTFSISLNSCKKELDFIESEDALNSEHIASITSNSINPFAIENIYNALATLEREPSLNPNRIYNYYKFNPEEVSAEVLKILEADTNLMIMDYPFADMSLYPNDSIMEENTSIDFEKYKDGNLYIMYVANSSVDAAIGTLNSAEKLDELYLPEIEDEDLQIQALISSGYVEDANVAAFRRRKWGCFFKQPHGNVSYKDQKTGFNRPVPNIKVWTLVFGLPISTHTDAFGNYKIPWRFNVGTIIGTHAKNEYATVKPFNTLGPGIRTIAQLSINFIIGSKHSFGWYSSCRMRRSINLTFNNHSQERLWAQILDAVHHHRMFAQQDNIHAAPNDLSIYAHWSLSSGAASAPMLGHIKTNPAAMFLNFISLFFDKNLLDTEPNFVNMISGLLPDVTIRVSVTESANYSDDIMETMFHELGHASLFRQVGELYWIDLITNILIADKSPCGGYGCGTEPHWGKTQVNEAWAEFIGKMHHYRFQPNGLALVTLSSRITNYFPYPLALEDVPWFNRDWINTGIFYDMIDGANERYDNIHNYTIRNLYENFTPNTNNFCDWKNDFINNYPNINTNDLENLMVLQNWWSNNCSN
jgi:hypothetical protein